MGSNTNYKVYILPNIFTTLNLFCGFYAIISAIDGNFFGSAVAILIAGVFDALDGRIARLTNTTSTFGTQYDSLCDLVSFGVAPALLAFQWILHPFGRYGWLAAFFYVASTALRLARFNSTDSQSSMNDFVGLPCPSAAYMIATTFLFDRFINIFSHGYEGYILALVYVLSYLMVSTHKYKSFKKPETLRTKTFSGLVAIVLLVIILATEPQLTFFALTLLYILSGPVCDIFRLGYRFKASLQG